MYKKAKLFVHCYLPLCLLLREGWRRERRAAEKLHEGSERGGECSIEARGRERVKESCAAVASHSRRLRTAGVCDCTAEEEEEEKAEGEHAHRLCRSTEEHRAAAAAALVFGLHRVEVPVLSPRRPLLEDLDAPTTPRPPPPTLWHKRPNISVRTRI